MVPIVLWLIFDYWDFWGRFAALVLLVLAASTDGIDGAIARRRNLVSDFGKLLDPIADKALLTGALVALVMQIIAVSLALAPFEVLGDWYVLFTQAVVWFTVVLTLWSGKQILWPSKL
jgi:CDP-diacylglycerol--glycerol-3-phosphate 3-phosphatidyltransferase